MSKLAYCLVSVQSFDLAFQVIPLWFLFSSFAVVVSPPGPVVLKRQKKDSIPQSVFTIPPELNVSLLLEFVG